MNKISGIIITHNEEKNIGRCLQSIQGVVDEIIVVDSGSSDKTEEICRDFNVTFIEQPFLGYVAQKNFALDQAGYDYVLSLDADEALSDELRKSILKEKTNLSIDAYRFNRFNNYCGKWLRYGQWYPDTKTRLWNKSKGRWGGTDPHDHVVLKKNATVKWLKGDLLHYSYAEVKDHFQQIVRFAEVYADSAYKKGKKANFGIKVILSPGFKFIKRYIFKLGFLDGYYGFVACFNAAILNYFKYINLLELQRKHGKRK